MAISGSLVNPVPLLWQSTLLSSLEESVFTMKPAVTIRGMSV